MRPTSSSLGWMIVTLAAVPLGSAMGAPFRPGDIVVVRIGDGSTTLNSASAAVFLDEYTSTGTLVQSVALPGAASGSNNAFTNSGSATSEGALTLSSDGQYLALAGYAVSPGQTLVSSTTGVNRVAARVDMNGVVDTSTLLPATAYVQNNIRGAVYNTSSGGFYTSGTGNSSSGGTWFVNFGGGAFATQLSTGVVNTRVVETYDGQVYTSSMSGAFRGVAAVGTGLPITAGQFTTLLPGFSPATNSPESAYAFVYKDANTLYVADDRTSGNGGTTATGGIQEWTFDGANWNLQYTLAPNATTGVRGLTAGLVNDTFTLFATTTSGSIVSVVDTGLSSTFTTVVSSAGTNEVFRGIAFLPGTVVVPEPASDASLLIGGTVVGLLSRRFLRRKQSV